MKDRTIYKDDLTWVFPTNIPIVPGHVLVCPVRCVATLDELTDAELMALISGVKKTKQALTKAFSAEGFNVAFNQGAMAGQSVPHLHIHVLPRKTGDTGITQYEPRQFLYRPGSRPTSPDTELKEVADLVKKYVS